MKVIAEQSPIPFSERLFTVELTGLELAVIKFLAGNVTGDQNTIRKITDGLYDNNPVSDGVWRSPETFRGIDVKHVDLKSFTQKVDELNK